MNVALRLSCLLMASVAAIAEAQPLPDFDLERLELNPSAAGGLVRSTGEVLARGSGRVALLGQYQHDPLVAYDGTRRVGAVVQSRVGLQLIGAWAPLDWLELSGQVPIVVLQRGDDLGAASLPQPAAPAVGAPRAGLTFAPLQQRLQAQIDVAFHVGLAPPIGTPASYSREQSFVIISELGAGRAFDWFRIGASLGAQIRSAVQLSSAEHQDEVGSLLDAAVSASARALEGRLRGELTARLLVPFTRSPFAGEVLAGVRFISPIGLELFALGGPGFGRLPGLPAFRIVAGVGYQKL